MTCAKKLTTLALSVFAATALMSTSPAVCAKQLVLKLGHIQSETDNWQLGALKFKEELEKRSNGQITLKVYPNSTLGGDRDLVEGMQMGTVDFGLVAGVLSNFEKSLGLWELPYLFADQKDFDKVVHGPIGKEVADRILKKSKIRVLNWWDRGPRQITSNKPIMKLADLKGLKIRLPEIPAKVAAFRAMGANPTPMAWSEVYTGLQQNVIEAQENPVPFIYGGHIQEVQKYIAMSDHQYEYVGIAMSEKRWKKLTKEQRKIVVDAANAATAYENKLVIDNTAKLLDEMVKGGLKVTYPDKAEFAKAARSVHAEVAKKVDYKLYQKILKTLGRDK